MDSYDLCYSFLTLLSLFGGVVVEDTVAGVSCPPPRCFALNKSFVESI